LFFTSNVVPKFIDDSSTISGRFIMFQMANSFLGKENVKLGDELLAELSGIFNWALAGLARVTKNGYLSEPPGSEEIKKDIADYSSPVAVFVEEKEIAFADNRWVDKQLLYQTWEAWCMRTGVKPGTRLDFLRALKDRFPEYKISEVRPTIKVGKEEVRPYALGGLYIPSEERRRYTGIIAQRAVRRRRSKPQPAKIRGVRRD
jgi:putative DNA primase/helicase